MACNVQPPVLEVETHPPDVKLSEDEVNRAEKRAKKGEPKTPQLPSLGEICRNSFEDRHFDTN